MSQHPEDPQGAASRQPQPTPASQPGHPPSADGQWHRLHPLTPLVRMVALLAAGIAALLAFGQQMIGDIVRSVREGHAPEDGPLSWLFGSALMWVLLAVVVVLVVAALVNYLLWRAVTYRIDADAVYLREVLIGTKTRSARLDRVQSIDVYQKIVPRLLGLAGLIFDVAGGSGSKIEIAYLTRSQAEALRTEMLARVRAAKQAAAPEALVPEGTDPTGASGTEGMPASGTEATHTSGTALPTGPAAGTAVPAAGTGRPPRQPEDRLRTGDTLGARVMAQVQASAGEFSASAADTLSEVLAAYRVRAAADAEGRILRVPVHRIVLAQMLRMYFIIPLLLLVAGVIVITILTITLGPQVGLAAAPGFLPIAFAFFSSVRGLVMHANFTAALSGDGLHVSRGLASTSRRTIRLERIQAVRVSQPLLWRLTGWWRVEFNMAGGETGGTAEAAEDAVLMPVGSADQALMMLALALPDPQPPAGISAGELFTGLMRAPGERGRGITAPEVPAEGSAAAEGRAPAEGSAAPEVSAESLLHRQPARSRLLDPLTYRTNGWLVTGTLLLCRTGRWTRQVTCVPHARVQSMRWKQGPLQRARQLATVHLDSTAGPVGAAVGHQDIGTSWRFFLAHAERTRRARAVLDGRVSPTEEAGG